MVITMELTMDLISELIIRKPIIVMVIELVLEIEPKLVVGEQLIMGHITNEQSEVAHKII